MPYSEGLCGCQVTRLEQGKDRASHAHLRVVKEGSGPIIKEVDSGQIIISTGRRMQSMVYVTPSLLLLQFSQLSILHLLKCPVPPCLCTIAFQLPLLPNSDASKSPRKTIPVPSPSSSRSELHLYQPLSPSNLETNSIVSRPGPDKTFSFRFHIVF